MLMEPGEVHFTKRIVGRGSYFVMDLPMAYFHKAFDGLKAPHLKHVNIDTVATFQSLLNFHRLIETGTTRLEAESQLMKYLRALLMESAEQTPKKMVPSAYEARLGYTRDYIHHHASSEIPLHDLAQVSGLSPFHFVRSFHARFGITPHAYQIKVRIAQARRMLWRREEDIPYRLGFSDQSHFIRHFKRDIGVTPGQYARMIHKPISVA